MSGFSAHRCRCFDGQLMLFGILQADKFMKKMKIDDFLTILPCKKYHLVYTYSCGNFQFSFRELKGDPLNADKQQKRTQLGRRNGCSVQTG